MQYKYLSALSGANASLQSPTNQKVTFSYSHSLSDSKQKEESAFLKIDTPSEKEFRQRAIFKTRAGKFSNK